MSGHSHWAGIKHKKGIEDAKRGKVFSKISRLISLAAREGTNQELNPKLKQAIEQAKMANMPKENIERAIKRGSGEIADEKLESISVEILGPGSTAIIVEGITDNKNRTLSEIKQICQQRGAKIATEGSVKWQFERMGIIGVSFQTQSEKFHSKEEIELLAIEAGAKDIQWYTQNNEDFLEIRTNPDELANVKKTLEEKGLIIDSMELGWVAKQEVQVSENEKETIKKFFEELDDNDAVQNIYSNLNI
jgi:YebC/PmpR family DNA-binding regulatory protein